MSPPAERPAGRKRDASPSRSFVLSDDVRALLADVAARAGISQVGVIELALRRLAHEAGRHEASQAEAAPFPGAGAARGTVTPGAIQSVRLSPSALRALGALDVARPRYGDTQVAVLELALRRFARFATREGLLDAPDA